MCDCALRNIICYLVFITAVGKSHLQVHRVRVQLYITVVYVAAGAAFGASK